METNDHQTYGPGEVQVFELTMDNDEDQDELNRRLRKPGEPGHGSHAERTETDSLPNGNGDGRPAAEPRKSE